MIITHDILVQHGACGPGIELFDREFPDGLDVTAWDAGRQVGMLLHPVWRQYIGWAWSEGLIPAWSMRRWSISGANLYGANLRGADTDGAIGIEVRR